MAAMLQCNVVPDEPAGQDVMLVGAWR